MELIILTGFVVGLTEVIKRATGIKSKFIPLIAIFISFLIVFVYSYTNNIYLSWDLVQTAIIGGLGSVGLWSGTKNLITSK